jgi:predicted DNA-binding protein with PD1-like motif
MTHSFDGYNYLIRLDKGDRLSTAVEQFMLETKIGGAWVSGLGAVLNATLGFYDLAAKEYRWQEFDGLRELVSLTGNLAANEEGKMMFHLHGVLSDQSFQTVGGHVKDLVAGGTVELFIHRSYQPMQRKTDPDVGLQVLDL